MRHVAVFGATGTTGVCVVRAALDKGLKIRALVDQSAVDRLPPESCGKVDVVLGDVLNIIDVRTALEGQEAAIVALGAEHGAVQGWTAASEGLKNIMAVMEALRINVLSVYLPMNLFGEPHQDQRRVLKVLEASELHWVAVDASHVVDQPASGYVSTRSLHPRLTTVSRLDLANFLVDCLAMPENYQKTVKIASIPRRLKVLDKQCVPHMES